MREIKFRKSAVYAIDVWGGVTVGYFKGSGGRG